MSTEEASPEDVIEPERRALINRFWEHRKVYNRAWAVQMSALHRMIGDPARADEYERNALAAADELTEANRQADLVQREINMRFPQVSIEKPDAGAWRPILAMLGLVIAKAKADAEAKDKP